MIQFDIKWAASGPAYVGSIFGIAMLSASSKSIDLFSIAFGAFFGAAMALPLCAAFFLAAILAGFALLSRSFAVQFGAFALAAGPIYYCILQQLNPMIAQLDGGAAFGGYLQQILFFVAGLVSSLICMVIASYGAEHQSIGGQPR